MHFSNEEIIKKINNKKTDNVTESEIVLAFIGKETNTCYTCSQLNQDFENTKQELVSGGVCLRDKKPFERGKNSWSRIVK